MIDYYGHRPLSEDEIIEQAWKNLYKRSDPDRRLRIIEARTKSRLFGDEPAPSLSNTLSGEVPGTTVRGRTERMSPDPLSDDPRKRNAYSLTDDMESMIHGDAKRGFWDELGERTAVGAYDFGNSMNLGTRGVLADIVGDTEGRDAMHRELNRRTELSSLVADRQNGGGWGEISKAEGFGDTARAVVMNVGEMAPSTLASMALGGVAAKGVQLGLRGTAMLAPKLAPRLMGLGDAMATPITAGGKGVVGKLTAGAKAIRASPKAAAARLGALSITGAPGILPEAEETYLEARDAGRSLPYAMGGLAINSLGGGALEAVGLESITGKGISKLLKPGAGFAKNTMGLGAHALTASISEGFTESAQEGLAYSMDKAMGLDAGSLSDRLVGSFTMGGILGGVMGGGAKVASKASDSLQKVKPETKPEDGPKTLKTREPIVGPVEKKEMAGEELENAPAESPFEAAVRGEAAFVSDLEALSADSPTYVQDLRQLYAGKQQVHLATTAEKLPALMEAIWGSKISALDGGEITPEELATAGGNQQAVILNRRVDALRQVFPDAPPDALAGMAVSKEAFAESGAQALLREMVGRRFDFAFLASLKEASKKSPNKDLSAAISKLQKKVNAPIAIPKRDQNHAANLPPEAVAAVVKEDPLLKLFVGGSHLQERFAPGLRAAYLSGNLEGYIDDFVAASSRTGGLIRHRDAIGSEVVDHPFEPVRASEDLPVLFESPNDPAAVNFRDGLLGKALEILGKEGKPVPQNGTKEKIAKHLENTAKLEQVLAQLDREADANQDTAPEWDPETSVVDPELSAKLELQAESNAAAKANPKVLTKENTHRAGKRKPMGKLPVAESANEEKAEKAAPAAVVSKPKRKRGKRLESTQGRNLTVADVAPPGGLLVDLVDTDSEYAQEANISPSASSAIPTVTSADVSVKGIRRMLAVYEMPNGEQVIIPLGELRSYYKTLDRVLATPPGSVPPALTPKFVETHAEVLKLGQMRAEAPHFVATEGLSVPGESQFEGFQSDAYDLSSAVDRQDVLIDALRDNLLNQKPMDTAYTGKQFYGDMRLAGLNRRDARRILRITSARASAMGLTLDEYLPRFMERMEVRSQESAPESANGGNYAAVISHFYDTGTAVIRTFGKSSPSIILHELSHHWRYEMAAVDPEMHAQIAEFIGADPHPDSDWTTQQEEAFATAMERYFFEGHGDPKGQTIWERFRRWMRDMYYGVTSLRLSEIGADDSTGLRSWGRAVAMEENNVGGSNRNFNDGTVALNPEFVELMNRMFVADSVESMRKAGTLGKTSPGFLGEPLEPTGARAEAILGRIAMPPAGAPPVTAMPNAEDIVTEADMKDGRSFLSKIKATWEEAQLQMTSRHIWGEKVAAKLRANGQGELATQIETHLRQVRAATIAANRVVSEETITLRTLPNGSFEYVPTGVGLAQVLEGVGDEQYQDLQHLALAQRYLEIHDRKVASEMMLAMDQASYDGLTTQLEAAKRAGNRRLASDIRQQIEHGRPKRSDPPYHDAKFMIEPAKLQRQILTMAAMQQKYGNDLVNLEAKLDEFRAWSERATLDRLVEVGRLSVEQRARIKAKNGKWAHLSYMMGEEFDPELKEIAGEISAANPIKYLKDGMPEGKVFDPIAASARYAQVVQMFVQRQHVINALTTVADQFPEMGFELYKADNKPGQRPKARERANRQTGVVLDIPEGGLVDKPVMAWRNGQRYEYYGSKAALETMQVLENVSPKATNTLLSIITSGARAATRMKRIMTTVTPGFLSRNILRDQVPAFINSTSGDKVFSGYRPLIDLWHGLRMASRGKIAGMEFDLSPQEEQWLKEYDRNMAGLGGMVSSEMMHMISEVEDLRRGIDLNSFTGIKKQARRDKRYLDLALSPLIHIGQILESGTRMGAFARARSLGRGMDVGINEAREGTVDFTRGGLTAMQISGFEAFFNPNIQDASKLVRNLKQRPGLTLLRTLIGITLPTIVNRLFNQDDEDWHNLHDWDRALFYHFKKDNGGFWRVPRPVGLANVIFGFGVDKFMDHMDGKDPNATRSFMNLLVDASPVGSFLDPSADTMMQAVLPAAPDLVQPAADLWANRDSFRGTVIDPMRDRNIDPTLRGGDATGPVTNALGVAVNAVSPAQGLSAYDIRYLIGQYGGGIGRLSLEGANVAARKLLSQPGGKAGRETAETLGLASPRPIGFASKPVVELKKEFKQVEQVVNSLKVLLDNNNANGYTAYAAKHPEYRYFDQLKSYVKHIDSLRDQRDELVKMKNHTKQTAEVVGEIDKKITLLDEAATQRSAMALDVYYGSRYKKGYAGVPSQQQPQSAP